MSPQSRRGRSRGSGVASRDQTLSTFGAILLRYCEATGAIGSALVDGEGETVDYAGALEPFDIKIAAAECALLLSVVRESGIEAWASSKEVLLRGRRRSIALIALEENYTLVALLPPHAFSVSARATHQAVSEICDESGLTMPAHFQRYDEHWRRVEVRTRADDRRYPAAIWADGAWASLELLGRYQASDQHNREIGYRARLESGAELNLVRERLGVWFVDCVI